jgi:hypothetical protein
MAALSRAIELRCDSLNVHIGGPITGRVGTKTVQLGDAKEFVDAYSNLVPHVADEANILRSRLPHGEVTLRLCSYGDQELGVHLLWR